VFAPASGGSQVSALLSLAAGSQPASGALAGGTSYS
jgi:hypothetical protein